MPNRNLFEARFAQHFRAPVPRPTSCPGLHHPVPATHSCSASSISCRAVERLGGQDCSPGGLRHGCFASREGIRDRRKSNHFMVNYGGSLGAGRCNRERLWRLADVVAIPPHHIGDEGDDARCPPSVGLPPFLFTGSASILGRKGSPTQPPASIRKVSLAVATNRIGDPSETRSGRPSERTRAAKVCGLSSQWVRYESVIGLSSGFCRLEPAASFAGFRSATIPTRLCNLSEDRYGVPRHWQEIFGVMQSRA
jgi:hypothetical protein